jgi:hypothetical protein
VYLDLRAQLGKKENRQPVCVARIFNFEQTDTSLGKHELLLACIVLCVTRQTSGRFPIFASNIRANLLISQLHFCFVSISVHLTSYPTAFSESYSTRVLRYCMIVNLLTVRTADECVVKSWIALLSLNRTLLPIYGHTIWNFRRSL